VSGPFPPGLPFVEFVVGHFYDWERWSPEKREMIVISLLTEQQRGQGLLLAVHHYWGLMEGLSPHVMADTMLLASCYTGIGNFTSGLGTLKIVLTVLKKLADSGNPDDVNCLNVFKQLVATFSLPNGPTL